MKAIEILVEKRLVPSKEERSKYEAQRHWLANMQSLKVLIENIIEGVTKDTENVYGEQSITVIDKIRYVILFLHDKFQPFFQIEQNLLKHKFNVVKNFNGQKRQCCHRITGPGVI